MVDGRVVVAVEVVTFRSELANAFAELNYEWIKHYFAVEEEDRKALDHPASYAKGGEIFFVLDEGAAVGTVAMVPYETKEGVSVVMELAKMAVSPAQQGKGYSSLLMEACIDYAMSNGVQEIMLVTNDMLKPALGLYTRFGFVAVAQFKDARYARGNLEMRLKL